MRIAVGAIAVAMVIGQWMFGRPELESGSVSASRPRPVTHGNEVLTGRDRERTLFAEIVRAKRMALQEARDLVPFPEGGLLPIAPTSRKGAAKRSEVAKRRTERRLAEISRAYGVTDDELDELYQRGSDAGWTTAFGSEGTVVGP